MKNTFLLVAILGLGLTSLRAQSSTSTTPLISNMLTVGDPGNAADTNDPDPTKQLGAVAVPYQIAACNVTVSQYCAFLNAVASHGDSLCNLYNPLMSTSPTVATIDCTTNSDGSISYAPKSGMDNLPIVYVSLYSAMRFCNWLQNGQPLADEGTSTTTEAGAYTLSYDRAGNFQGASSVSLAAQYYLPSVHQWYKAAYYQGKTDTKPGFYWNYATCSNDAPSNLLSDLSSANAANYLGLNNYQMYCYTESTAPFLTPVGLFSNTVSPWGAFDMGGNVSQWVSTPVAVNDTGGSLVQYPVLGGSWRSTVAGLMKHTVGLGDVVDPSQGYDSVGFRVAAPVPDASASSD